MHTPQARCRGGYGRARGREPAAGEGGWGGRSSALCLTLRTRYKLTNPLVTLVQDELAAAVKPTHMLHPRVTSIPTHNASHTQLGLERLAVLEGALSEVAAAGGAAQGQLATDMQRGGLVLKQSVWLLKPGCRSWVHGLTCREVGESC